MQISKLKWHLMQGHNIFMARYFFLNVYLTLDYWIF